MVTSNTNSVRFASYNCRSVKNTIQDVRRLCNGDDVILVQEHWLMPTDQVFRDSIHKEESWPSGILVRRFYRPKNGAKCY